MSTNFSQIDTTVVGYKDLDLRFKTHPLFGDVKPVTDVEAIKNSIKNILLTRRGEKPFNPAFGSNVADYLFENSTNVTKQLLGQEIEFSVRTQEPRVQLQRIDISDDIDNNAFVIRLDVIIVSTQEETDISLVLKRLR